MAMSQYNDYVLNASVQAGWITDEQRQVVEQALGRLPGVAALDFMGEQGLLSAERIAAFRDAIEKAMAQSGNGQPAEAAKSSSTAAKAAVAEPAPGGLLLRDFLALAVSVGASDMHITPYNQVLIRHNGRLLPLDANAAPLTPEQTEALSRQCLDPAFSHRVEEIGSVDFCYEAGELGRFRTSVVRQRRGWEAVYRVISSRVRSMQELGLTKVMFDLIKYHNGIILVTGSVGSGKTTTMAAMIDEINKERKEHIITLEDPIEYVFQPQGCQITQREIHSHTESFAMALRGSLRQDPDVIMVGEMRDLETTQLAITASETGHLVLATLHTSNAPRTMQRLLDVFPVDQQAQIRMMVSESLRGVICQQLIPRAGGQGRVLALEIMTNTPAIANLIREGKTHMIPGNMQTGRSKGMRLMDDSLLELFQAGLITPEEAHQRSENQNMMAAAIAAAGMGRRH
jgi:twitching motility protein PilT